MSFAALAVVVGLLFALVGGRSENPPLAIAPFDADRARRLQQAWAEYLGVPAEITNSIGMRLVLIPPGQFEMGSSEQEVQRLIEQAKQRGATRPRDMAREAPKHRVRITKPFYLGTCEVTQSEYESVMGDNPSYFSSTGDGKDLVAGEDTSRLPVEAVPWGSAFEFCQKLSILSTEIAAGRLYRLPTEAEWEYACRAGTTARFHFGDDETRAGGYAWFAGNSAGRPHAVGQKKSNAWGLYDMHGNVWEWCADRYGQSYYAQSPFQDPKGPSSGDRRILRGGTFGPAEVTSCRSANRASAGPKRRNSNDGFRVVCEIPQAPRSAAPATATPHR
jgi:formylglycine-generating enzyme required for sulfatase activity